MCLFCRATRVASSLSGIRPFVRQSGCRLNPRAVAAGTVIRVECEHESMIASASHIMWPTSIAGSFAIRAIASANSPTCSVMVSSVSR